ncbi:MAG: hypothetical protein DDT38_01476 [Firmicutes bacterium]|nr:hypothetical protein [candidate division NPL-UPA2 bacterium]
MFGAERRGNFVQVSGVHRLLKCAVNTQTGRLFVFKQCPNDGAEGVTRRTICADADYYECGRAPPGLYHVHQGLCYCLLRAV